MTALLSRSKDGLKTVGKKLEGLIQEEGNELIVTKQKSLAATTKSKSVDLVKKSLPLIKELTKLCVAVATLLLAAGVCCLACCCWLVVAAALLLLLLISQCFNVRPLLECRRVDVSASLSLQAVGGGSGRAWPLDRSCLGPRAIAETAELARNTNNNSAG